MNFAETITINGLAHDISQMPLYLTVLDMLRTNGQTAAKIGCNEGDCGACTILLLEKDGPPRAINGCLALVHSLCGRSLITAEGLHAADGTLHPAQQAMIELGGSQCGYCTPGFICSMAEASARGISQNQHAVADQLCGNLCRCTGYRPIREAAASMPTVDLPQAPMRHAPERSSAGYFRPQSIEQALRFKNEFPDAVYLCGATELAVLMHKRHDRPQRIISLEHIVELNLISENAQEWRIGAAAVLTDIEAKLGDAFPALNQMLRWFASRQIRHRATLGGNLVTASPIGDAAPVLLVLDAELELASLTGSRRILLADFFTGYRQSVLRDDELLAAIYVRKIQPGHSQFFKVSKRREMDISTVSMAFRIAFDAADCVNDIRLAYGGVAATPLRAKLTEERLLGVHRGALLEADVIELLESEFTPMDDVRGSAMYRRELIGELWKKAMSGERECLDERAWVSRKISNPPSAMPHESARGHVTGAAHYVDDMAKRHGALQVWLVRSPYARAQILAIDCESARVMPGVRAVLTAADITGHNNTGPSRDDEPLFAENEVSFHGQLIAAIIAETLELARLAAEKVVISFEPLKPLLGIEEAMAIGSFHTDGHQLDRGDVDAQLSQHEHLLEGSFHIGGQEHFYLETHATYAEPDGANGVFLRSSTQHPSETQTIVAEVLGWSRNQVVVESPRMGGGFGGKETQANPWAALCALAAVHTGMPVALQLDRDEDMESSGKRHPFFARFRVAYDGNGRLHAADVELFSDGGWSLDLSLPVNDRALFHLDNAYYIPHVRFRGRVCKTNTTSHTAFRGFGGPQGMLVIEEIMARIALSLGMRPEQLRRANFYHGHGETNTTQYGEEVEGNRLERIWAKLLESSDFDARRRTIDAWNAEHPGRKRGIAITPVKFGISFTLKHYNQAGALVLIYADGSVQVNHGGTEMGQGLHTKILGIAMRELGVEASRIRLMHTRTDKVPNTSATAASCGSDLNGMAVSDACSILRERLAEVAAPLLGCDSSEVSFHSGFAHCGEKSLSFAELANAAYVQRVSLSAAGFYRTPDLQWDWNVRKGKPFHYFAFGAAVSEVEIDGFTGMQHARRVDILHDVGNSLNSLVDRGQIEGGFVQGLGWLTCEELRWNGDGILLTHSASTYAIPTISDAPLDFRVDLLDDAEQPRTIFGSKAVGEPPLMLAISAREAIRDAICAFGGNGALLPSPLTSEAIKLAVGKIPTQA